MHRRHAAAKQAMPMHICVGHNRTRLATALPVGPTLLSRALGELQRYEALFLEFGDRLYVPLASEPHIRLAVTLATMEHEQAVGYDDDHWIEEAHAMEAATEEHMLAPDSSSDNEDSDSSSTVDAITE